MLDPLNLPFEKVVLCETPFTEYLEIACLDGVKMKIKVKNVVYLGKSAYQEIKIYDTEDYGRCLFLDDVIQCSEKDHEVYDKAILKKMKPTDRNLLVLGGGDGHTAKMALRINPEIHITIVELDETVVNACKLHLDQRIFDHPNVDIVTDDAIRFLEQQSSNLSYDGIVCDLTDQPVGHNNMMSRDFYLNVFSIASTTIKQTGWISIYAGCNVNTADEIIESHLSHIEKEEIYVPSFGEPCFFLHS